MSYIVVDYGKCTGCGACADVCSEIFEIRHEKAWVISTEECKTCDSSVAVRICPERAIFND